MGTSKAVGTLMGMWVNIFEGSPLTAVVPALMALLGFGLPTMVVTVFLFSVWVIALDTQVGSNGSTRPWWRWAGPSAPPNASSTCRSS